MGAEREMTLEEWVARLPEFHPAHRQYTEMRENTDKLAAEIVRLRGEVEALLEDPDEAELAYRCGDPDSDAIAPAEAKDPAPAMPNGVEGLVEALEMPDGYEVQEFLPGGWHYAWTRSDGERMASGTTWNHPALAAIAAWQAVYDRAADNRDAAGVICRVCDGGPGNAGSCLCGERKWDAPAAVPAGEAVAWLASDGEVFTDKESADRHSKVWGVNPLSTPLYTTPPAPVQAAPQEDAAIAAAFREVGACSYAQDGIAGELFAEVRKRAALVLAAPRHEPEEVENG